MNQLLLLLISMNALFYLQDGEADSHDREVPKSEAEMWVAEGRGTVAAIPFRRNERWGYLDLQGRVVIEPQFRYAERFKFGRACVGNMIIDQRGEMVLGIPSFVRSVLLCEDCFWFSIDGAGEPDQWGLMDYSGKILIEESYSDVRPFSDGLAAVNRGVQRQFPGHLEGGQWGFVNRDGKEVIPLKYHKVDDFHEGLAVVETVLTDNLNDRFPNTMSEIIDLSGKVVFQADGICWGNFSDGLLSIQKGDHTSYVDRYGVEKFRIDGDGRQFFEKLAVAHNNDSKALVIDLSGRVIFEFDSSITDFHNRLASFSDGRDRYGFIDRSANVVIAPIYNEVDLFIDDVSIAHRGGTHHITYDGPSWWVNGVTVLIDAEGHELAAVELDEKEAFTPKPALSSGFKQSCDVDD